MKKQTAVEQFKQEFFGYADPYPYFSEEDKWVITERELLELLEKAKEMEKEQKIKFAEHCLDKALDLDIRTAFSNVEYYYNEQFKSE